MPDEFKLVTYAWYIVLYIGNEPIRRVSVQTSLLTWSISGSQRHNRQYAESWFGKTGSLIWSQWPKFGGYVCHLVFVLLTDQRPPSKDPTPTPAGHHEGAASQDGQGEEGPFVHALV